jgi:hypothetical protein
METKGVRETMNQRKKLSEGRSIRKELRPREIQRSQIPIYYIAVAGAGDKPRHPYPDSLKWCT